MVGQIPTANIIIKHNKQGKENTSKGEIMNLLVIGAGGHGKCIFALSKSLKKYNRISFLDDNSPKAIGKICDYPKFIAEYEEAFVAIGNPKLRRELQEKLKAIGYRLPVLIHANAILDDSVVIGDGTVIMAGAIVQPNVHIGKGCIISAGAIIDHDTQVKDFCHVNSGAVVASMSQVPEMKKIDYKEVWRNV